MSVESFMRASESGTRRRLSVTVVLVALVVLLATAFWQQDELSGQIIHTFTWDNVRTVKDDPTLHAVTRQTVQMAVLVTITDILLAFPLAYYMARVASRGVRALLLPRACASSLLREGTVWRATT